MTPEPGCVWDGANGTPSPAELARRVGLPSSHRFDERNDGEWVDDELDEVGEIFADVNPGYCLWWTVGDCFITRTEEDAE